MPPRLTRSGGWLTTRPRSAPVRRRGATDEGKEVQNVGATKNVTDATFEVDVLKSEKPVIVDYWAEWCGPCRQVSPILEEIASEHDEIQVVKLNVDENPKVSQQYGIMNIPTMSVFKGGEVVKEIVGAKPKSALLRDLAEFLSQ